MTKATIGCWCNTQPDDRCQSCRLHRKLLASTKQSKVTSLYNHSGLPCLITMKEGPQVPAVATLHLMTRLSPCSLHRKSASTKLAASKQLSASKMTHKAGRQQTAVSQQYEIYKVCS
jgi:hypothetical protein